MNRKRLRIDHAVAFANKNPILPPDDVMGSVPAELRRLIMDVDPELALSTGDSDINDACDHLKKEFINITRPALERLFNALLATMTMYLS